MKTSERPFVWTHKLRFKSWNDSTAGLLYSAHTLHCLYTQSPQNAIQSQQTDKVGNNGIVEIYDVKSYQIESNFVM